MGKTPTNRVYTQEKPYEVAVRGKYESDHRKPWM